MIVRVIGVLALCGCDAVFGLKSLPPTFEDALTFDAISPPPPCAVDGTHDEDQDSLPDACDLCPTITSGQSDGDGDHVGDECDPRTGLEDKIAGFYPLDTLVGLTVTNAVTVSGDGLTSTDGAFATNSAFTSLERVTVDFSGFASASASASIVLTIAGGTTNQIDCQVTRFCTNGASVCLDGYQHGQDIPSPKLTLTASEVTSLTAYRDGDLVRCGLGDVSLYHTGALPGAMPSGQVKVSVVNGPARVESLILYATAP